MNPTTTPTTTTAGDVARAAISLDARTVLDLLDQATARGDAETVHACRVAVRRLRADVRSFRPLLDRRWVSQRRGDLHSLHRALAAVRHLDVRAGHLAAAAEHCNGLDDQVAPLLDDLANVRVDALAALRVTLADETRDWLAGLADGSQPIPVNTDPGSDAHIEAVLVLPALLRRPWRHLRDATSDTLADDNEQLRIWSRRCRYIAEATLDILGQPAVRLADSAAALHTALGELHEAVELQTDARALHDAGLISGRLCKAMRHHADELRRSARPRARAALADVLAAEHVTRTPDGMRCCLAGGGVVWRPVADSDGVEVIVVHRPAKNDWSLPKGRLQPGEDIVAGARREVEEETGLVCSCDVMLPPVRYVDRRGRHKEVWYWEMRPIELGHRAGHEVDEVRWLPITRAIELVDKRRDRKVLGAFEATCRPAALLARVPGPTPAGSTRG